MITRCTWLSYTPPFCVYLNVYSSSDIFSGFKVTLSKKEATASLIPSGDNLSLVRIAPSSHKLAKLNLSLKKKIEYFYI